MPQYNLDNKFSFNTELRNIVNTQTGSEIPLDEPRFLLVGRDICMLGTLEAYYNECVKHGSPDEHIKHVCDIINQVRSWQQAHAASVNALD